METKDPHFIKTIEDLLDNLARLEKRVQKIDRKKILDALEILEELDVAALRDAVESLQAAELDMRMTRIRIHALTGIQTPNRTTTEDTPVEPIIRRRSSATIRAPATDPMFPRTTDPFGKKP